MKKIICMTLAVFICLSILASAVPDSVVIGPYNITFDLGIPKEAYKVEIEDSKTEESLSGEVSTTYTVNLINKTGISRRASIILTSYETEQVIPLQDELVQIEKYMLLQMDYLSEIDVAKRKIDGKDGAAGSATMRIPKANLNIDTYAAIYYPSSTTIVNLISAYPWENGTLSLLKTIHVEKMSTTS